MRSEEKYKTEYVDAGVELDGPLFELMGNKLRWSAGLQVAKEDISSSEENFNLSGEPVNADDVLGGSSLSLTADRRRLSAFGDILVPLGNALDVSFALRHDDFDDVGGALSHRVATLYRVIPQYCVARIMERGSAGSQLRSPACRGTRFLPACMRRRYADSRLPQGPGAVVTSGNPELEPDEAESFGAGASAGWGPFSADFDWFASVSRKRPPRLTRSSSSAWREAGGLTSIRD